MRIGVTFPQIEIGVDPVAIRDFAQAIEGLGYRHLIVYDHILGTDPRHRPDWTGPYTSETAFYEVFVLMGHLASITTTLEFATGVLVLPQRPAVLVAKQAAALDLLSGGRLRVGVGVGYDANEFQGLGANFKDRGARCDEQIELLRRLWTEPLVTFEGKWHTVTSAGIMPMPVQRPIPIWIGGQADAALRRAARYGDGFFPIGPPDEKMAEHLDTLRAYAREEGREPAKIGVEARISVGGGDPEAWRDQLDRWRELGATHVNLNTMWSNLRGPAQHLAALERAAEALNVGAQTGGEGR